MTDPDLEIRGGGEGGGRFSYLFFFWPFRPQFGLKISGGGGGGRFSYLFFFGPLGPRWAKKKRGGGGGGLFL